MKRPLRQLPVVAVAVVILLTTIAVPAMAAPSESGTAYCGSNNIAVRVEHTKGSKVFVPIGTLRDSNYVIQGTATWTETTFVSGTSTWKAEAYAGGDIKTAGTWAFCWGN